MMIRKPGPRAMVLTAVLQAMAALLFYREHRSAEEQVRLTEDRLAQLASRNEQARSLASAGEAQLTRHLEDYAARIARLERLIPRSEEVPALLESLAAEARRSGLGDLVFIRPAESEPSPFYTRRSYEVLVEGGYHEVARFLTAIASLPRIITPVELEMTALPGLDPEADSGVNAHFWIETYVRPPAEIDVPVAGGGAEPVEAAR